MGESELFVDGSGAITYEGRTMSAVQKKSGKFVLDVDGKRIRVTPDQFVLMYTYFSVMFKYYSKKMEQEESACA